MTFTACLVVIAGCSDDKPKPRPKPADGVVLVTPGASPQTLLRYHLTRGTETPIELALDLDLTTVDATAKLPTMAMSLDVVVVSDDATGAKLRTTVVAGGARARGDSDAAALAVMDRQTALLGGLVVTSTVSPAGEVSGSKVEAVGRDLSGPLQDQVATLVQATERLAMTLPIEPVGVGAVWKHRKTIQQNQLRLMTITTVQITAIEGDRVTFSAATEMTGADQMIAQGGETALVTKIHGRGTQQGSFDLASAIVLGEQRAELGFEMIAGGQPRPTTMVAVTRITPRTPLSPEPREW